MSAVTIEEKKEFLREYMDEFLDVLLPAYEMTVDAMIGVHMSDELAEWLDEEVRE